MKLKEEKWKEVDQEAWENRCTGWSRRRNGVILDSVGADGLGQEHGLRAGWRPKRSVG